MVEASIKVIKIEMSKEETQELVNAIFPIATDKIETPNYIHEGVKPLYEALKKIGFNYRGD